MVNTAFVHMDHIVFVNVPAKISSLLSRDGTVQNCLVDLDDCFMREDSADSVTYARGQILFSRVSTEVKFEEYFYDGEEDAFSCPEIDVLTHKVDECGQP